MSFETYTCLQAISRSARFSGCRPTPCNPCNPSGYHALPIGCIMHLQSRPHLLHRQHACDASYMHEGCTVDDNGGHSVDDATATNKSTAPPCVLGIFGLQSTITRPVSGGETTHERAILQSLPANGQE
eukprot:scaffold206161_cov17-Tisochrysis_lutea.AAC.2